MRTGVRCLVVAVGITTIAIARPTDISLTAVTQPSGPTIESVLPTRGEVVGVAQPIVVTFVAPVTNRSMAEHAIDVKTSPAMTGRFDWQDNKVVQWVPDRYWPAHTTIALSVDGHSSEFKTGAKVVGVASISQHTFRVTIDDVDAGPPPTLPAPHHRPHFGEPGVLPASLGRPEYSTPVGSYTVLAKDRAITMDSSSVGIPVNAADGYLLTVNDAVRISNHGLFVHSAPWAVNALGLENVSHGCISLSPDDADWYFNTVNLGDPVIVQE
jgi:lipoprotein-anchoring transpeptidase ErfK/SrfK